MRRKRNRYAPTPDNPAVTAADSRETFFTWFQFLDYVRTAPIIGHGSAVEGGSRFHGTDNFAAAEMLALTGWSEGAETANKLAAPIFDHVSSLIERHSVFYDVEGAGLDVARYLDGEPECWQRWQSEIVDGPGSTIVRICLCLSASAGVSSEVMTAKGAAVAALVELLEYAGRRVELTIAVNAHLGDVTDRGIVLIKAADQPLDGPRVAFCTSHPAMFRRLGFRYIENGPVGKADPHGLGKPLDVKNPAAYDLYIGRSMYGEYQWTEPDYCEQWVKSELEKQGVKFSKDGVQ